MLCVLSDLHRHDCTNIDLVHQRNALPTCFCWFIWWSFVHCWIAGSARCLNGDNHFIFAHCSLHDLAFCVRVWLSVRVFDTCQYFSWPECACECVCLCLCGSYLGFFSIRSYIWFVVAGTLSIVVWCSRGPADPHYFPFAATSLSLALCLCVCFAAFSFHIESLMLCFSLWLCVRFVYCWAHFVNLYCSLSAYCLSFLVSLFNVYMWHFIVCMFVCN